jgi:hypothetical protein
MLRPRSGSEWLDWYRTNAARVRPVPWETGAGISLSERLAIGRSLQGWQLGETSDGRHLRAVAVAFAARVGDPDYVTAVDLFIREEQRHGELLGRFLDLAGIGRRSFDWGDCLFRIARYGLTSMETWTTPVIMVETLATIYYAAIRRATGSPVLWAVCTQILADEGPHLRFQCERLARIYRRRSRPGFRITMMIHRVAFATIVLLVWIGHRSALRAGGLGFRSYWRAAWQKMAAGWRRMDPRRYDWDGARDGA